MEDLKQIQEFFSKPLEEISTDNVAMRQQYILTEPVQIAYTDSFGTGISKARGVLHQANAGYFIGEEDAYIIILPGGTFYVSEDEEVAMRIWPIRDQSNEFGAALAKTPFAPKYADWKDSLRKAPVKEADLNDPVLMKMRAAKMKADKLAKIRAANAGDDGNDKFFDAAKLRALKKKRAQIMRDMEQEAEMEGGPVADKYGDMLNKIDKAIAMLSEYNTGIYYKEDNTADKAKDAAKSGLEKVRDFVKKVMKEEEITIDDATEFKINLKHLLDKHEVKEEEGYSKFLKTDDNPEGKTKGLDTKTMNKILMNVIKDLDELKQLGEGEIKESLNPEVSKAVSRFIKAMAKRYDYSEQDAVYAIMAALKQRDFDGVNEATEDEENEFHKELDKLVHKTFGHSSDEKKKSVAQELAETIKLGEGVIEEELCPKGKAYIKKRQAAGEKSSAYLSGRAVKVCKGQMKG